MRPEPNLQCKIPLVKVRHQQCNLVKQFKLREADGHLLFPKTQYKKYRGF